MPKINQKVYVEDLARYGKVTAIEGDKVTEVVIDMQVVDVRNMIIKTVVEYLLDQITKWIKSWGIWKSEK